MIRAELEYLWVEEEGHFHLLYAKVEPRGSNWMPWFRRTSIWWYEVHEECTRGCDNLTHAYEKGGSGGAWFLHRAINKAWDYAERITWRKEG